MSITFDLGLQLTKYTNKKWKETNTHKEMERMIWDKGSHIHYSNGTFQFSFDFDARKKKQKHF